MFNKHFDDDVSKSVVFHWFLLSFSGGFINAGGFTATGRFVSHVTGFATLFGVDIANSQFDLALGIVSVPLFYLLGAFLAGLLIDRPRHFHRKPHYDWVMGLCGFFLFMAAAIGGLMHPDSFGESTEMKEIYLIMVLLCLACGLQNGAITSSSGRSVRTTHLTGLTTDLGLGLAKLMTYTKSPKKMSTEWRANFLRSGTIASFVLGSAAGAILFLKAGYTGFVIPGLISCYAAWHGRKTTASALPH